MHTLAKILLILATVVTVALVGAFLFVTLVGRSENASLALHWFSVAAVILWIPVAGISILLMAVTAKKDMGAHPRKILNIEWGVSALHFLLSLYLINSRYLLVWRGITEGWIISPALPMLTLCAGLLSLVASVAIIVRHKWALHSMLILILALFAMANYEALSMYHDMPFVSFLVYAGINNFAVMIVLASYIYIKKRRVNA